MLSGVGNGGKESSSECFGRSIAMSRHHKRGFGYVTKQKLPSQLIPVARLSLDEETENKACEENEEDDVMPTITIPDTLANAPFAKVSIVITGDDE